MYQRKKRSVLKAVLWALYGVLVFISAIIVAVYLAFRLLVKPPEQVQQVQNRKGCAAELPGLSSAAPCLKRASQYSRPLPQKTPSPYPRRWNRR